MRRAFLRRAAEMLTLGELLNVLEDPESDLT